ncbi:hypothetical protein ABBQ38_002005 [Trebouxia sp. C0009 RCD-2024]
MMILMTWSFAEARDTAAEFRAHGGFQPVQNGLMSGADWHVPMHQGRFVGDRQNINADGDQPHRSTIDVGGTTAATLAPARAIPATFRPIPTNIPPLAVPPTPAAAAAMLATREMSIPFWQEAVKDARRSSTI